MSAAAPVGPSVQAVSLLEAASRVLAVAAAPANGHERGRDERVQIIVARDQQALYDYLRWGFSVVPNVEVILDRRLWRRRQPAGVPGPGFERRKGDRRRQPGMRAELLARGFVVVRVPSVDLRAVQARPSQVSA